MPGALSEVRPMEPVAIGIALTASEHLTFLAAPAEISPCRPDSEPSSVIDRRFT
jgi:hypothetical protein